MIDCPRLEQVLAELPEAPDKAALVAERLGLDAVTEEARLFALTPLLARYLPGRIALRSGEEAAARFNAARHERLSFESLALLESAGIRAVLLKGLDLATRLYPERWLRPAVDVDVLVSPGDLESAIRALSAAGWKQGGQTPKSAFEFTKDIAFLAPKGGMLELHFGYNADFQARIDPDALIARSRLSHLGEKDLRVLCEVDDLLIQCVHAAHHGFTGVKWMFDLKLVARTSPDWFGLIERAREYRVASAVGMALGEAVRRMHAPVPPTILRRLPPGPLRARIVRRVARIEDDDLSNLACSLMLADGLSLRLVEEAAVRPLGRLLTRLGLGEPAKRVAWQMARRFGMIRRRDTTPGVH